MISLPGYTIECEVGKGGMANVYLAVQNSLSRLVAIKVLAPHLSHDVNTTQRFMQEGRIAAGLRHRHIVPIFDVGIAGEYAFMALAWMPRGSLAAQSLPLSAELAVRLLREMAAALGHAHAAGIVHRDVKPENILLDDDGAFVLADFGIAQLRKGKALTGEGLTVGTPAYMAPEQWRGGEIDGRADLYSLGIVFYECLTGRVPFTGNDAWSIGLQHMQAPLPMLTGPLARWQNILDRLLAKMPEQRFSDARSLLRVLDQLPDFLQDDSNLHLPNLLPAVSLFESAEQAPLSVGVQSAIKLSDWREWLSVRRRRVVLVALLGGLFLLFGWFGTRDSQLAAFLTTNPSLATVMVLPCESFGKVAAHQELGDTLAQVLIHRLSRLRELTLIARSTAQSLAARSRDPRLLGQRSGATHLLACTVRRAPTGVRIGAELIETRHGTVRWSAEFERSSEDLLSIADELALGISERLLDQLAGRERAHLMRNRATSLQSIALVGSALEQMGRGTADELEQARITLESALHLDPNYPAASVAMAQWLMQAGQGVSIPSTRSRVDGLLIHALTQDPDSAAAFALRAALACGDYDWPACLADIQQALSLAPADAQVQSQAARLYLMLGAPDRSANAARRWVRSEPDSARAWHALAQALINAGQTASALDIAASASARFPDFAPLWQTRALALQLLQRCPEAVAALERALELEPPNAGAASVYACAGQPERVHQLLRSQQRLIAMGDPVDLMSVAVTQLALGQKEAALATLESMYQNRDANLLPWITQPQHGIAQLAGQPRLIELIDQLHLPEGALRWQARQP